MKSWFDLSGVKETLKGVADVLVAMNVAVYGDVQQWSVIKITVTAAIAAIAFLGLFSHVRLLKSTSLKFWLWMNGTLVGIALLLYASIHGLWSVLNLWLNRHLCRSMDN